MNQEEFPVLLGGQVWIWRPIEGMDMGVSMEAKWAGAVAWAEAKLSGKSDKEAHTAAEKVAYEIAFRCRFI